MVMLSIDRATQIVQNAENAAHITNDDTERLNLFQQALTSSLKGIIDIIIKEEIRMIFDNAHLRVVSRRNPTGEFSPNMTFEITSRAILNTLTQQRKTPLRA